MHRSLAEMAVNDCLRITAKDNVSIFCGRISLDLAEELSEECFKKGADVIISMWTDRFYESFMKHLSVESLRQPSAWCVALAENSTAGFWLGAINDPGVIKKVPPEKLSAAGEGESKAHEGRHVRNLFLGISSVTRARAKAYGFNYNAWYRTTLAASKVDLGELRRKGGEITRRLEASEQVQITAPNGTDLRLSVKGRKPRVNDGIVDEQDVADGALRSSLPAGSVTSSTIETSANGTFVSEVPTPWAGRTIKRLVWEFRDGKVTRFEGDANADILRKSWEPATGDKDRVGWLSIGLNPKMKLAFLGNELASGAIGVGIGSNVDLGGTNKAGYRYAQVTSKATIRVDGETIVEEGRLKV